MSVHAYASVAAEGGQGGQDSEPHVLADLEPTIRLVPGSAIQFLDFTLAGSTVAAVRRSFIEDRSAPDGSLYAAVMEDGVLYHPVTGAVADAAATLTLSGIQALEPFLDAWLPLPIMRVREPAAGAEFAELDEGPSNWARVFISRARIQDADASYRVVLALDTACDKTARTEGRSYSAPSLDDVRSGALFRFSDEEADIAWFVSEAWVDDWLKEIYQSRRPADELETDRPTLEYLACFLTLLTTLSEACGIPDIAFVAPHHERVPVGVDLILDIGHARTAAFVREGTRGTRRATATRGATPIAIRDLSQPWRVHDGVMSSRLEFMAPSFGREALSRLSGRTNAFLWPSIVRVGAEAERLAAQQPTTDHTVPPTSPIRYLWDEQRSPAPWRFARPAGGAERGGIVCGPQLAHVAEDGHVIDGRENPSAPIKPRFSRASLTTLLAAELIAHAHSFVNSPTRRGSGPRSAVARRIDRILLTVPAGLLESERAALRKRVEEAARLVWSTPAWQDSAHAGSSSPMRQPEIRFVHDNSVNAQLVWLHNEISGKFQRRAREYFQLLGKQRTDVPGGRSLRVGCLDFGAGTTGLSIATYLATEATPVAARLELSEGVRIGSDDVARAIVERHVIPALARELAECGLETGAGLLADVLGGQPRGRPAWVKGFARRFMRDIAYPVALALISEHIHAPDLTGDMTSRHTIGSLLALARAPAGPAAEEFDALAADEGAVSFSCHSVPVAVRQSELAATIAAVLHPAISAAAHVLEALDCDVVLLSGWLTELAAVRGSLIEAMPMRPGHVIALSDYRVGEWYTCRNAAGKIGDSKALAAAGASIAVSEHGISGAPLEIRPPVPSRHVRIGLADAEGMVRDEASLFTASGPDEKSRSAPPSRIATFTVETPATLGVRRLPLETWPATPIGVLDIARPKRGARPKPPVKATVELGGDIAAGAEQLRLVKMQDSTGAVIPPADCSLTVNTLRSTAGYWLDTGAITLDTEETDA